MSEELFRGCKASFSPAIIEAAGVAIETGQLLSGGEWSRSVTFKEHMTFGTSSVTESDKEAQKFIINKLRDKFPGALFVGEEGGAEGSPYADVSGPVTFMIDPQDGTTEAAHDLSLWSVSIGIIKNGVNIGGVITAPEVRKGLTVLSERGNGVWYTQFGTNTLSRVTPEPPKPRKPVLQLGVDVQRLDTFQRFIGKLPKDLRPRGLAPSGALGLAYAALGRVDVLVQSPQMPWDWCAGIPQCIEAGRTVHYYRILDEKIVPVPGPSRECYRTDKQTLGFVLGRKELADEAFELLVSQYGK